MAVRPLPGLVYLNPTQIDGASGTPLTGLLNDEIIFEDGRREEAHGSGFEDDAWTSIVLPGERPKLYLPLQGVDASTYQLLFATRSSGTGLDSDAGNGVPNYGVPTGPALVIRPRAPGEDSFWYSPRVVWHGDSVARLVWSRNGRRFEGTVLVLYPRRSLDGSKQAWKEGTYAALNTAYGLPAGGGM